MKPYKYNDYVIVNQKNQKLSCFYLTDMVTKNQLKYQSSNWMSFPDIEVAQEYIDWIISKINPSQKRQAISLTVRENF